MVEIARLTPQTTIERDEHGRAWIVTTDRYIGLRLLHACEDANTEVEEQEIAEDFTAGVVVSYKAPLLDAHHEIYAYREGQDWCWVDPAETGIICEPGSEEAEDYLLWKAHVNIIAVVGADAKAVLAYLDIVKAEEEKG